MNAVVLLSVCESKLLLTTRQQLLRVASHRALRQHTCPDRVSAGTQILKVFGMREIGATAEGKCGHKGLISDFLWSSRTTSALVRAAFEP